MTKRATVSDRQRGQLTVTNTRKLSGATERATVGRCGQGCDHQNVCPFARVLASDSSAEGS